MQSEKATLLAFLVEVCKLWSPEVRSEWRELQYANILYLSPRGRDDTRGIELVFGAKECQVSIGTLVSREYAIEDAEQLALVQALVVGAVEGGVVTWKCSRRSAISIGRGTRSQAEEILHCKKEVIAEVYWEPWISHDLADETRRRYVESAKVSWL